MLFVGTDRSKAVNFVCRISIYFSLYVSFSGIITMFGLERVIFCTTVYW